ncbi:MAG: PAS domain-containing protein [Pseudomonadota bacterium]
MRRPIALHWQVAAIPAALAVLLVLSVLGLSQWLLNGYLEDRAATRMRQAGAAFAFRLAKAIEQREDHLRMIARVEGQGALDPALLTPVLQWAQQHLEGSRQLAVVDLDGRVIASTEAAQVGSVHEQAQRLPGEAAQSRVGRPRAIQTGGGPVPVDEKRMVIEMAVPLPGPQGRLEAVLVSSIDWWWFVSLREPILGLELDSRGEGLDLGIYSTEQRRLLTRMESLGELDPVLMRADTGGPRPARYWKTSTNGGRELLMASIPVGGPAGLGWQVVAVQDLGVALRPSQTLQRSVAAVGVLAALVFGALGYKLSRRLMQPYERLLAAMTRRVREASTPGRAGLAGYLDVLTAHARDLPMPREAPAGGPEGPLEQRPLTAREVLALLAQDATRLQLVLDALPSGVLLCDCGLRVLYWNEACRRMFAGWSDREVLGRTPQSSFAGGVAAETMQRLHEQLQQGHEVNGSGPMQRRDGEALHCEWHATQARDATGNFVGYLLVANDTTAQHQAQSHAAALTQRLMSQEKEMTQRIAQSLHDRLGQTLLAIRLSCEVARSLHGEGEDGRMRQLDERIASLIAQAFLEVRRVLIELRPPLLEEEGLEIALDNELRSRAAASPRVRLVFDGPLDERAARWPADVEYAAFMVAREAIANALMHGQPSTVRVVLSGTQGGLRLRVEDDGVGLPAGGVSVEPGHLGVVGMRERATAIGAAFSIGAGAGGGTVVELHWTACP